MSLISRIFVAVILSGKYDRALAWVPKMLWLFRKQIDCVSQWEGKASLRCREREQRGRESAGKASSPSFSKPRGPVSVGSLDVLLLWANNWVLWPLFAMCCFHSGVDIAFKKGYFWSTQNSHKSIMVLFCGFSLFSQSVFLKMK